MYKIEYNRYRTIAAYNSRVRFLIFHYTALNFKGSVTALTGKSVSAHYLVPDPSDPSYIDAGFKELTVFNLVNEQDRAWHAGISAWEGRNNLNDSSIGVETVNLASDAHGTFEFPEYHPLQKEAIRELAVNIVQRYPDITPTSVVGHSDIAYTRKSDPGPRFPWYDLYLHGVGAWYDDDTKAHFLQQFKQTQPSKNDMMAAFRLYGYSVPSNLSDVHYTSLIRAFQMHFRPSRYDGAADAETCAILFALNQKYRQK